MSESTEGYISVVQVEGKYTTLIRTTLRRQFAIEQ